jgi:hypothetical protein
MRSQQVGKIETDMQMAGVEVGPALPQFQYRANNSPTTQQITRTLLDAAQMPSPTNTTSALRYELLAKCSVCTFT